MALTESAATSDLRELAPRPPNTPAVEVAKHAVPRKGKVAVACEGCRFRRIKCDGTKPRCRACSSHSSECVYATPARILAKQHASTIDKLKNDNSALYEVLWYLQTTGPEQAASLLDAIRANNPSGAGAILEQFAQHRRQQPDETDYEPSDLSTSTVESPITAARPGLLSPAQLLEAREQVRPDNPASPTLLSVYGRAQDLSEPLEWFFNCVGALFYIMDKEEVATNIRSMKSIQSPLGDIVRTSQNPLLTTTAAELAGMASIGVVHAQLAGSTTAPPAELADYFYAVAKSGLDTAIEHHPLRAIKICALIAMYNVLLHATVSLAYLDLGISLARRYGADIVTPPSAKMPAQNIDISRTYRTLVHLQCWLSASLDYVPDALGTAALQAIEDHEAPPEDMIRRECVKVSIIKAEMLHKIPTSSPVPEVIVRHFQERLQTFYDQLPSWMSLQSLLSNTHGSIMAQFRPVVFYVHLFYLSAMMLLSRRLVIAYIAIDASTKTLLPEVADLAIRDGFMAAQTNAQVIELMLSEGKIVQVCWLCIFTSYTAGLMIAYGGAQKAIHGDLLEQDLNLLRKCIRVLSYCALKDEMAGRFRDLLSGELRLLEASGVTGMNEGQRLRNPNNAEARSLDTLFDFTQGSSELHLASRRLLSYIHRPFSGLSNARSPTTFSNRAETAMGTHLEWEWELKGSQCFDDMAEPRAVCNMESTGHDAVQDLKKLPDGAAWSTWTRPVGI